jgi:hypothetical protein
MNAGGGGGASHVTAYNDFLTNTTARAATYIVAGGGGGAGYNGKGGDGGGLNGGNGVSGIGGTQTGIIMGKGEDCASSSTGGGGGGGWYGGNLGNPGNTGGAGGGSGYIDGVTGGITAQLTQPGFVPNPETTGHGYVIITSVGSGPGTGESDPVCVSLPGCDSDCPPIENLQAQYVNGCDVLLTWDPPSGKGAGKSATVQPKITEVSASALSAINVNEIDHSSMLMFPDKTGGSKADGWIKYSTEDIIGTLGWDENTGNDMIVAIRFTAADLASLGITSGQKITKVAIGYGTEISRVKLMELKIWEGGTSPTVPGTLVVDQPINYASFNEMSWNEVNLTTPFVIDATKELRIGYRVDNGAPNPQGGYPFAGDSGPVVAGKATLPIVLTLAAG